MFNILSLLYLAVFFLIIITYFLKKKWQQWLAILLPPLLILCLIRISIGEFTLLIFWFPGGLVFAFSVVSIIVHLAIVIVKLFKKSFNNSYLIRFIRPALTIICFLSAVHFMKLSIRYADEQGIKIARQLHQKCNDEKTLPDHIEGWQWDSYLGQSVTLKGRYGTRYPISYSLYHDDPNRFTIQVRHNIEDRLYIHGGIGQKLQKQYHRGDLGEKIDLETKGEAQE